MICLTLYRGKAFWKGGDDPSSQRNVAFLDMDTGRAGKGLNDWKKRRAGQLWGLVYRGIQYVGDCVLSHYLFTFSDC